MMTAIASFPNAATIAAANESSSAPPPTSAHADDPTGAAAIDRSISSTTPDVPRRRDLDLVSTLAWAIGIGAGVGALLLRPKGIPIGHALLVGARNGAIVGGGMGAALLVADRYTNGAVGKQVHSIMLDRRAQVWFVLRHLDMPWLTGTGLGVANDARAAQEALYGRREPLDGPQDAFRHAYAAALFAQRMMRDHSVDPARAKQVSIEAGAAHEADGQDNNDEHSRAMDFHNNEAGVELVGDGRAGDGSWHTDADLQQLVLDAMSRGRLEVVDRRGSTPTARRTTPHDLPPSVA